MTTTPTDPEIAHSVDVNGVRTNYHDVGAGEHTVLLIHGSGPGVTAWANWRLTMPELAKRFRVLAPDIPGFGYTERPDGTTYDLAMWTNHLAGFLDALDVPQVFVVGNSFGGALALSLSTQHPDRVAKIVLMGAVGVPFEITPGLDAVWGFEPSLENMHELLGIFAYDQSLMSDELAASRLAAATRPGIQEAFSALFPEPRQAKVDALTIPEERLRAIEQPTLVIHGRDDQVIPMANALTFLELISRSQLHIFGQCGHWVQIEHAEAFSRIVGDFLAE